MANSSKRPNTQVCGQMSDAERLRQDYESRLAAKRPITHSVAVAYRQLIARCEQKQSNKHQ